MVIQYILRYTDSTLITVIFVSTDNFALITKIPTPAICVSVVVNWL